MWNFSPQQPIIQDPAAGDGGNVECQCGNYSYASWSAK